MVSLRLLGLFAVALCFTACLCASALVSKKEAEEAVEVLKVFVQDVRQIGIKDEERSLMMKRGVRAYRKKFLKAESDLQAAAKGNAKANVVATKIKSLSKEFNEFYPIAENLADVSLKPLFWYVPLLHEYARHDSIEISPNLGSTNDYSQVLQRVSDMEAEIEIIRVGFFPRAKRLLREATASFVIVGGHVEKMQVAKYEVDAVISASEIEAFLGDANNDIQRTEDSRNKVSVIVDNISALLDNTPQALIEKMTVLLNKAKDHLRNSSRSLKAVTDAQANMLKQKKNTDDALGQFQNEIKEDQAQREVENIKSFAKEAAKPYATIKPAKQAAETSAVKAKELLDEARRLLLSYTGEPETEASTETQPAEENPPDTTATPPTTTTTAGPIDGNAETPAPNTTTKPTTTSTAGPNDGSAKTPAPRTTTKPPTKSTAGPIDQSTKDVMERVVILPLNDGAVFTSVAGSDRAMAVSCAVLMVLVACATAH